VQCGSVGGCFVNDRRSLAKRSPGWEPKARVYLLSPLCGPLPPYAMHMYAVAYHFLGQHLSDGRPGLAHKKMQKRACISQRRRRMDELFYSPKLRVF
jgi:hypothetical protein